MQIDLVRQAALELFAVRGFSATGIRDIARASGINSATLYHYVGSKEEFLVEMIRACLESMIAAGEEAMRASSDPTRRLAGLVMGHVGVAATNPLTARVAEYEMRALSTENARAMQRLRDEYEAMFATVVAEGVAAGQFDLEDQSLTRLALLEMCTGVAHWYRRDGRVTLPELQRQFVHMACRLVGADQTRIEGYRPELTIVALPSEPR